MPDWICFFLNMKEERENIIRMEKHVDLSNYLLLESNYILPESTKLVEMLGLFLF